MYVQEHSPTANAIHSLFPVIPLIYQTTGHHRGVGGGEWGGVSLKSHIIMIIGAVQVQLWVLIGVRQKWAREGVGWGGGVFPTLPYHTERERFVYMELWRIGNSPGTLSRRRAQRKPVTRTVSTVERVIPPCKSSSIYYVAYRHLCAACLQRDTDIAFHQIKVFTVSRWLPKKPSLAASCVITW